MSHFLSLLQVTSESVTVVHSCCWMLDIPTLQYHFSNSLESTSNKEKQFFQRPLRSLPMGTSTKRLHCSQSCMCMYVCCEDDIVQCIAAKDSPLPFACVSHVLPGYWSCLWRLAGEGVCVAKSHSEWPPCPRPGQTCHLCNGYHISAPLFMLSNGALISLRPSSFSLSLAQITV